MKILINGKPADTDSRTLAELLDELEHDANSVATAINQEFVAIGAREGTALTQGDTVEIVAPMAGG